MIAPIQNPTVPERTIYKLLTIVLLVGGIVYCNAFTTPFYLDDTVWIKGNPTIDNLGSYVFAMKSRPLIAVSLYANHRLHGESVFGYHVVNVFIHLLAACALFGIVRRTLLLPRWENRFAATAHWLAFAVALLWVVHPLHTQAITYIIQRCESMMGLFYFITLYCLIRGSQSSNPLRWYLGSWASCILGAGCKEVMVTILPVMLCYDRVFMADWREIIRKRWWFYTGITAIWGLPFIVALPFLLSREVSSAGFGIPNMPADQYMMTQAGILLYYLRLCLIPYPQYFFYRGWPLTTGLADFWPSGLALGCLLLAIALLTYRRSWLGFLGVWFFGILSITSIIPLLDVAFEHRLYLPLAAFCTLVVMTVYALLTNILKAPWSFVAGGALLVIAVVALGFLTMRRNDEYRINYTLWMSVLDAYPNNSEALFSVASGLENARKYPEAIVDYEKCLKAEPQMFGAESRYGELLCRLDRSDEGIKHLLVCLQSMEREATFHQYRGEKYHDVARAFWIRGDLKMAESMIRKAIDAAPDRAMYHTVLGLVLGDQKHAPEAHAAYEKARQLDPNIAATLHSYATRFLHRYPDPTNWTHKEALFYALQAAQVTDSKDPAMLDSLAEAYALNGMQDQARATVEAAAVAYPATEASERRSQLERVIASYQKLPKAPEKK